MKVLSVFLITVLLLGSLAGCAMEERLERFEDRVENKLDAAEDAVENALTPTSSHSATTSDKGAASAAAQLTQQEAEAIALEYAGFTAEQVSRMHTEYEIDDGVAQYDVQFYQDGWEYEFEIHAETGAILSYDRDR